MKTEYTTEPWSGTLERGPDQSYDGPAIRIDLSGYGGAVHLGFTGNTMAENPDAYADRIISCVNALAGYNPAAIAEAVAAFGEILALSQVHDPVTGFYRPVNPHDAARIARAALAKLKGQA